MDQIDELQRMDGTITDEDDNALVSAAIYLKQGSKTIARTGTNNSGGYQFIIFPQKQTYDLSATWGEKGNWSLGLSLHAKERHTIDLKLASTASISGSLFAWDNTRHREVIVQAVRIDNTANQIVHEVQATTVSDEDGNYRFINLKPGYYLVRCYTLGDYIYYEPTQEAQREDISAKTSSQKNQGTSQHPTSLQLDPGVSFQNIDFRFAPFRKGIWKNYTYLNGLASNTVYDIHQDADGVM